LLQLALIGLLRLCCLCSLPAAGHGLPSAGPAGVPSAGPAGVPSAGPAGVPAACLRRAATHGRRRVPAAAATAAAAAGLQGRQQRRLLERMVRIRLSTCPLHATSAFSVSLIASKYLTNNVSDSDYDLQLGRALLLLHARHVLLRLSCRQGCMGMARPDSSCSQANAWSCFSES